MRAARALALLCAVAGDSEVFAVDGAAAAQRRSVLSFPVTGLGNVTLFDGDEPCAALRTFCDAARARGAVADARDCARQLATHVLSSK